MTRLFLAAGVAALAITAPAVSAPGDRGGGKDRDAQAERAERGGGKARAQRTERRQAVERRADRGQAIERRAERRQAIERRAPERREMFAQRAERRQALDQRAERRQDIARAERAERIRDVREQRVRTVERRDARPERVVDRRDAELERFAERRGIRLERIGDRRDVQLARLADRDVVRLRDWDDLVRGGIWLNGCPPGLAKKPVACIPPGQVNKLIGQPVSVLNDRVRLLEMPDRLRFIYPDTDDYYYRWGNGYAYRIDRDTQLISALLPLFGLGLTVGQPFPMSYPGYYMPSSLQPFYMNSPYDCYRYANGYVYEVDCVTGLIEDVDPLLGYGYGYGQMLPLTYSAYNVPFQYRPLFYDTDDYWYRYAPGAIYQVDPTTSLITAVAALLTGGLTVGQPLPVGYSAYNVPFAYRTTYFDTPDAWYRYSNGYIYRVDPETLLVTALVASALT